MVYIFQITYPSTEHECQGAEDEGRMGIKGEKIELEGSCMINGERERERGGREVLREEQIFTVSFQIRFPRVS